MNKQELAKLRFQLITAVTDYDRKQSTKPSYNIYALPQYFARVDEILSDVESGADPRSAITAGFVGTLQNFVLRKLKMSGSTMEEARGGGSWYYKPVAKKNPVKPRKGETERKFVSRCMSEEKQSFPKLKQRIAVCLSKARKNPLLESGATISKNSGINRRAASMT